MAKDEVLTAEAGTSLVQPRGQWHTFGNAGDEPCHMIEIVSPAGVESYFREVADAGGDMEQLAKSPRGDNLPDRSARAETACKAYRCPNRSARRPLIHGFRIPWNEPDPTGDRP